MRRPPIYSRSRPGLIRPAQHQEAGRAAALRRLSAQVAQMTDVADALGAATLADLIDDARLEAERLLRVVEWVQP